MRQLKSTTDNKMGCLFLNFYLLAGVSFMVYTAFYLLFHLNNSDKIIYRCIPGFIAGISSVIVYGYLNVKKPKTRRGINE
jgi:hypothetical protein